MKALLQETNNYSLFISNDEQRPINPIHVRKLAADIKRFGFLPSKPIQCYKQNGKYVVVDGHHRIEAARAVGASLYFVVEPISSQESMAAVNLDIRKWSNENFVKQYCHRGNKEYLILEKYVCRGIPLRQAASMLAGESAHSGNASERVRNGTFKVKTTSHIDKCVELIESNPDVPAFRHNGFIKALSLCLWLPEFDFTTFKHRAKLNNSRIPNCSNMDDFLRAIEEVYNFRSKTLVPLAINAKQASKLRAPSSCKK